MLLSRRSRVVVWGLASTAVYTRPPSAANVIGTRCGRPSADTVASRATRAAPSRRRASSEFMVTGPPLSALSRVPVAGQSAAIRSDHGSQTGWRYGSQLQADDPGWSCPAHDGYGGSRRPVEVGCSGD